MRAKSEKRGGFLAFQRRLINLVLGTAFPYSFCVCETFFDRHVLK